MATITAQQWRVGRVCGECGLSLLLSISSLSRNIIFMRQISYDQNMRTERHLNVVTRNFDLASLSNLICQCVWESLLLNIYMCVWQHYHHKYKQLITWAALESWAKLLVLHNLIFMRVQVIKANFVYVAFKSISFRPFSPSPTNLFLSLAERNTKLLSQ